MTQEEIYNGNVEIAKMLGWVETTLQDKMDWLGCRTEERLNNIDKKYIPILKFINDSKLDNVIFPDFPVNDYSKDWYYLMNAVEFIEKQNTQITIKNNNCKIEYLIGRYIETIAPNKKQAVFIAVSQFAKMYNNKQL